MSTLVGLDVGTSAVKAIAVAPDGKLLARREVAYPLSTPRPGWAEQDPEDWWRATRSGDWDAWYERQYCRRLATGQAASAGSTSPGA